MTDRENNIRHISQFLRDIQQISEYSTNRNTFNININYYEKYYNGYDNESSDVFLDESSRVNREPISTDIPTNRYYVEINGERRENISRNAALNQQNNVNVNTEQNNLTNNQNTANIASDNLNSSRTDENNNLPNSRNSTIISNETPRNNIIRRQITIPVRASSNNWVADLNNTYPVNLTNSLSDIGNIINQTLTESFNNIGLDNLNIEIDSSGNNSQGLTINSLNTKTALIVYSTIDSENRETKCHICNEDYSDTDICRKNNLCGHYLHQTCLDNWYSSHNTCPICNRVV
tara:strand:- start:260 stop:1132 length:873 start_codon:yes stop_codon:yes gene_type:complete